MRALALAAVTAAVLGLAVPPAGAVTARPADESTGEIHGRVTSADSGRGVEHVLVRLWSPMSDAGLSVVGLTDATGHYSITEVPAGDWDVCFDPFESTLHRPPYGLAGTCYSDVGWNAPYGQPPLTAAAVTVRSGQVTSSIDGTIEHAGRLTGSTRLQQGVTGAGLRAYLFDEWGHWQQRSAVADDTGKYVFDDVARGRYAVCVLGGHVANSPYQYGTEPTCTGQVQWTYPLRPYGGGVATGEPSATVTEVDADAVARAPVVTPPAAAAIQGTVTSNKGAPLRYATIQVFDQAGDLLRQYEHYFYSSSFLLTDIDPSTEGLIVCIDGSHATGGSTHSGYVGQCSGGVSWVPPPEAFAPAPGATPVVTASGALTSGVDAVLSPGGAIHGEVTDARNGKGIPQDGVEVYAADGTWIAETNTPLRRGGGFTVKGLPKELTGYVVCTNSGFSH